MNMIKTRHGEAVILWVAEEDGQMEIVLELIE